MMAIGKVIKFDETRGFGFIAPTGGREDVFLHVNDLLIPEYLVRPGTMLEFDIDEGERGLKASNVSLRENDQKPETPAHVASAAMVRVATAPAPADNPLPVRAVPASSPPAPDAEADEFCDLLTATELSAQVTELLLAVVPPLTGEQVLAVRGQLTGFAKDRGWLVP
jgi:cold shock protein